MHIKAKFVDIVGAEVRTAQYGDGSLALLARSTTDFEWMEWERMSTNLADVGFTSPEGCVFVKRYAEHEGLPEALEAAGVGTIVPGEDVAWGPFDTTASLLRLSDAVLRGEQPEG